MKKARHHDEPLFHNLKTAEGEGFISPLCGE